MAAATAGDETPSTTAPAQTSLQTNLAWGWPVHVRFIQLSNRGGSTQAKERYLTGPGRDQSTQVIGEAASRVEGATGLLLGYLIVESPLSELHFEQNAKNGTYSAHALLTQSVRNAAGKAMWTANKDVRINGPLAKLPERQKGNVYLMRDVLLPGGGQYTLEGTVQDLLAGKTGGIREPLSTGAGVPGLMVSDAMFVKAFHSNIDKFEADSVLNYQGNAIAPLLNPVFPANAPFKVDIYFVLYPDVYGPQPEIEMEIVQNGAVVGKASLPFKSMLRTSAQEGKRTSIVGELQHGFDYLATMTVEKMSASGCQARVSIRQGGNVVTRTVNFRVADAAVVAQTAAEPKTSN
jgi:hypothetical protein